jgi:hypothetical protein
VPPTPSPPLGESRHRAPSSYFFNWARPLPHPRRATTVPWGNAGHRPDFLRRRPPTRRGLSATPPSCHLLGEPPPMAPCLARPSLHVSARPGRCLPPQPPVCRRAPRPEVPDGVPPMLHLSTSTATLASTSASAVAVGSPPTSAPAPVGSA